MFRKIVESLVYLVILGGAIWTITIAADSNTLSNDTNQLVALIFLAGLFGLIIIRQKRDEEVERLIWLFPGDMIRIKDVSDRPLMKKYIGKEFRVERYGAGEIWAKTAGVDHQLYFKPDEVVLVSRGKMLIELTNKYSKRLEIFDKPQG